MLSAGDFTPQPVETHSMEIRALDDSFNTMAGRVKEMIENEGQNQRALRRAEYELLHR